MSKTKKTVFKTFDYMHCDDFARYLEKMAAKGWHFKEWGVGLIFEKGEPKQITYSVEVFTKAKESDLRAEPETREFAKHCEAAGWKLIDAKQKFCIFQKADENAVDILTPEERVKNSFKASFSVSQILVLILYGMNAVLQFGNTFGSWFYYNIFSGLSFFNVSVWSILFLTQFIKAIYAITARYKLIKLIKNGQEIYIGSNKDGKKIWNVNTFSMMFVMILFLLMLVMLEDTALVIFYVVIFVGVLAFSMILAKVRPEAEVNMAIQITFVIVYCFLIILIPVMIFSNKGENENQVEKVPLQITDYRQGSDILKDVTISCDKNMLGSRESYFLSGKEENLHYAIYRSKYDWILNRIWEDELEKEYNKSNMDYTQEWEAETAFRNEMGDYYVRYEDVILILGEYEDVYLVSEQILIIRDKLELR